MGILVGEYFSAYHIPYEGNKQGTMMKNNDNLFYG